MLDRNNKQCAYLSRCIYCHLKIGEQHVNKISMIHYKTKLCLSHLKHKSETFEKMGYTNDKGKHVYSILHISCMNLT